MRHLILVAGIVAMTGNAGAQSSGTAQELLALQQARFAAAITQDVSILEQMVAAEVRYCHTTGRVDTKTSYLDMMRTGSIDWLEVNPSV